MILKSIKVILQLCLIYLITLCGNWIQETLHIPVAGSIIGLSLFFLLLQFKIIKTEWISSGANLLLGTMIFFFIPSIVGAMDLAEQFNSKYIALIILIIASTCIVALTSGYVAEKMLKSAHKNDGDNIQ